MVLRCPWRQGPQFEFLKDPLLTWTNYRIAKFLNSLPARHEQCRLKTSMRIAEYVMRLGGVERLVPSDDPESQEDPGSNESRMVNP